MGATFRNLVGIILAAGIAVPAYAASEFTYSIPPGWRDLRAAVKTGAATNDIPQPLLVDAISSRFAANAVDPRNTTSEKASATFNATESPNTGRVTLEGVNTGVRELVKELTQGGLPSTLVEAKVVKMNGVDVGMTMVDVENGRETRRLVQYLIPGRKSLTVLTFASAKEDFGQYIGAFDASARATKGGYSHGWFSFERMFIAGGIGALVSVCATLFTAFIRKRRDADASVEVAGGDAAAGTGAATAAPAKPALKMATKYTWICPSCNNPVPMRIDQCRCGAAKPV